MTPRSRGWRLALQSPRVCPSAAAALLRARLWVQLWTEMSTRAPKASNIYMDSLRNILENVSLLWRCLPSFRGLRLYRSSLKMLENTHHLVSWAAFSQVCVSNDVFWYQDASVEISSRSCSALFTMWHGSDRTTLLWGLWELLMWTEHFFSVFTNVCPSHYSWPIILIFS